MTCTNVNVTQNRHRHSPSASVSLINVRPPFMTLPVFGLD